MGTEYHKIYSPFKRHIDGPLRNKLNEAEWFRPEFETLAGLPWHWTEKVDGTNVRIIWDGHKVTFGGRTDNAQMPTSLLTVLRETFTEELLEQQFGAGDAVLYGEGYGAKIQKGGGNYRSDQGFVLFDVKVGSWWLLPDAVVNVATAMGLNFAPWFLTGTIHEAVAAVRSGVTSAWGNFPAEGLVGRPPLGILARDGDRLLVKVKAVDFTS